MTPLELFTKYLDISHCSENNKKILVKWFAAEHSKAELPCTLFEYRSDSPKDKIKYVMSNRAIHYVTDGRSVVVCSIRGFSDNHHCEDFFDNLSFLSAKYDPSHIKLITASKKELSKRVSSKLLKDHIENIGYSPICYDARYHPDNDSLIYKSIVFVDADILVGYNITGCVYCDKHGDHIYDDAEQRLDRVLKKRENQLIAKQKCYLSAKCWKFVDIILWAADGSETLCDPTMQLLVIS